MLPGKPWRAEIVILLIAAQFACLCFGLAAVGLLHKFGVSGFKASGDFGNILLGTLCFQGVTWLLIPAFLRSHQTGWREAFGFEEIKLPRVLLTVVVFAVVILPVAWLLQGLSIFTLTKLGWPPADQTAVELMAGAKTLWLKIYLDVFAVVIAPVAEEFIFRGVLFPFVRRLGYPRCAWFGVSAVFAAIHFDVAIFVPLFALALALTWLYEETGSLLAPITAHALFNAANLMVLRFGTQFIQLLHRFFHLA